MLVGVSLPLVGQSSGQPAAKTSPQPAVLESWVGQVAIGVKASTYGGGVEAAVSVTDRTNVRVGFNIIDYGRNFSKDGITYNGQLSFRTLEAHYDVFPWANSFHISGGVVAYLQDPIAATARMPANQSFSLGGVTYYSDPADPTTANGKIVFDRVAPTVTFGFGNLVPRNVNKHFTIPVEFGIAFQGAPKSTLGLDGGVCTAPGVNCIAVPSNPQVLANEIAEQNKINNSMSFFKVYPIISVGIGYKF
jgi:hypothetical protein